MVYTKSTVCSPREQVIRNVMELIRQGSLSPDSEVPAETLLAERFGVSRGTVRSGLAVLAARGVIEKRGRRMHVSAKAGGCGSLLMNRTIILLGFSDKDEAIRKRNSGFMDAIPAGALEEGMERDMHTLWLSVGRLQGGEVDELMAIRPGGILLFSPARPASVFETALRRLSVSGIPMVTSVQGSLGEGIDHVLPDHAEGTRLLTGELLSRGCRRILCYLPRERREYWVSARYRGYCAAMLDAGLAPEPLPENSYWGYNYDEADAWEESRFRKEVRLAAGDLLDWFKPGALCPDAILAKTDWDVPVLAAALRLLGREPGKDVTIVGYDNKIAFNGWSRLESYVPPLTVDKRNGEIGRRMAVRLLTHIEDPESWRPENILVAPGLIATESARDAVVIRSNGIKDQGECVS